MNNKLSAHLSKYPYAWLMGLTGVGICWVFGPLLFNPNGWLLGEAGDALKTYYALEYFLRHNESALHQGMNYPYGNHPLFLDMNPLLAYLLKGFQALFGDISPYTVGIVNVSIFCSFFPCVIFVYKILRRNLIPDQFAIPFSLVITFLSPQILRFTSHLALSYIFFVPMLWYMLPGVFSEKKRVYWALTYIASLLVFAAIHPYYYFIGLAFIIAYGFVLTIQGKLPVRSNQGYLAGLFFGGMLPAILLRVWESMLIGDTSGFVQYPYGFFAYIAGFESVFLPLLDPLHNLWEQFIRIRRMELEGYAYVGFAGLVALGYLLLRIGVYIRRRQFRRIWKPILPKDLQTAVWAGALLLIVAMAYPFKLFPESEAWLGPLRQFRSLGRLAWPFYYTYMALSAFLLWQLVRFWRMRRRFLLAGLVPLIAFCSWGISSWVLVQSRQQFYFTQQVSSHPERRADFQQKLEENGIQASDFQAMLGLPFYHIGTEKIGIPHYRSNRSSFAVSLNTGLPLINNKSARMPLIQGMEAIQLAGSPLIHKELLGKLPSELPLLISYTGEPLQASEQQILDQSDSITTFAGIQFYAWDFRKVHSLAKDQFEQQHSALRKSGRKADSGYYLSDYSRAVVFEGFGDGPGQLGKSVLTINQDTSVLFDGQIPLIRNSAQMEASVWIQTDVQSSYLPPLDVTLYQADTVMQSFRTQLKLSTDYDRGWIRGSIVFRMLKETQRVVISIKGKRLRADHLLIRPVWIDVAIPSSAGSLPVFNNYFQPLESRSD